eukprot:3381611-Rhodomonas_salina.1
MSDVMRVCGADRVKEETQKMIQKVLPPFMLTALPFMAVMLPYLAVVLPFIVIMLPFMLTVTQTRQISAKFSWIRAVADGNGGRGRGRPS